MTWRLLLLISVLIPCAAAQSELKLRVDVDMQSTYAQAQQGRISFTMVLEGPNEALDEGVLFLNVVERDPAGKNPQAAHKIFASAKETPKVFRQVYTGADLQKGVETTLEFQLRDSAKLGDYTLVVQLYRGSETNPNRVKYENRLALKGFNFSITE